MKFLFDKAAVPDEDTIDHACPSMSHVDVAVSLWTKADAAEKKVEEKGEKAEETHGGVSCGE